MDTLNVSKVIQSWSLVQKLQKAEEEPTHKAFQQIRRAWILCVDASLFERSRPVKVQGTTLYLVVDHGKLIEHFSNHLIKKALLQTLQQHCPGIQINDLFASVLGWNVPDQEIGKAFSVIETHPSYCTPLIDADSPLPPTELSPIEAFEYWRQAIEKRRQTHPDCPTCGGPAPKQEMLQWGHCRICYSVHRQGPTEEALERSRKKEREKERKQNSSNDDW